MTMTKAELERASELMHAREQILEFFSARDPESELVRDYLKSPYPHQVKEGKILPTAGVCEISIRDADKCVGMDEDADTLHNWDIPRDVLEAALKAYMPSIERELRELGVAVE